MGFRNFNISIIIRFILIFFNLVAISYVVIYVDKLFTILLLTFLLIIQVTDLLRYLTKIKREIDLFIQSLKHGESITRFYPDLSNRRLYQSFNEILEIIESIKIEKEAQFHFLNIILKKAGVGIITLSESGKIEIINQAAQDILNCGKVRNWNEIENIYPVFATKVNENKTEKNLIEFNVDQERIKLSLNVSNIKIMDKPFRIVVFQNIRSEIEQSELDSWNKLIRTLAHEIMNSITPITSLTETSLAILEAEEIQNHAGIENSKVQKLKTALQTIEKRGNSLMTFVESFRNLARIPNPEPKEINLKMFFEFIKKLYDPIISNQNIKLSTSFGVEPFIVFADEKLLEQLFLNLIKNSLDALNNVLNPEIIIHCYYSEKFKIIEIKDNGSGIHPEDLDRIFIPFYSTKENGTGIGLSLVRQIMQLHKGKIDVSSELNLGTKIKLTFP